MAGNEPRDSYASPLLDALPEAAVVLAPDGVVRYANDAVCDLLGHDRNDLEGQPIANVLVAQSGQRIDPVAWLARWAEEPASPQLRYLTLTGRTRAGALLRLSVRVAKLTAPSLCYLVTLRDVTAEQREHLDVKHAYLVVSRILAIADDAIVNLDAEQRVKFFNRSAERLFGHRADEVLGKPIDMLLPARFRGSHGEHVRNFQQGPAPSRLMGERGEIVGLTKGGEEIPLEASITKVFIDGVPTFSAHLRDIRARKSAEQALKESEQRFRTIFEHALEAIALLEPSGKVLAINQAAQRMLGEDVRAIGVNFWELPWWGSQQSGEARREAQARLEETVSRCAAGEEIRLRTELGAPQRVIDFSLRPVVTDGRVTSMVAEGRDITAVVER